MMLETNPGTAQDDSNDTPEEAPTVYRRRGNPHLCVVPGCGSTIGISGAKGLCYKHYDHWRKYLKNRDAVRSL